MVKMANSFLQEKLKSLSNSKSKHRKQKHGHVESIKQSDRVLEIEVDPDTRKPTRAWERLKEFHPVHELPTNTFLDRPREKNSLRFVCISDTHGAVEHERREYHQRVPDGDVLIHCGDFTMGGNPFEIVSFDSFISRLPHPVKLVIAGNHEMTFEKNNYSSHPHMLRTQLGLPLKATEEETVAGCKALLQHMLYLEDETVDICGIKIYGTPWVPEFGTWGFSVSRGENLLDKWNQIPSDTDILITHGPPCGYGDSVKGGNHNAGCVELLNTVVKRVKPKYHVFGHIHTSHGMWTNGKTTFINAAVCSDKYNPAHDPVVFDCPLPRGYTREDFAKLSTESLRQAREQVNGKCEESESDSDRQSLCQAQEGATEHMNGKCEDAESSVAQPHADREDEKRSVISMKSDLVAQIKGMRL